MAANRVGKTYSAAFELACHLTGNYPEWWEGLRFDYPINAWALGATGEQMRDVIQSNLVGDYDGNEINGKGAIPYDSIDQSSVIRSSQTRGLIKDIRVKHSTGAYSTLSLKSYSQGQHVLMGQSIDYILIDEEPKDQAIYPQCVTRTATGNRGNGGYVTLTFTPENGRTPLVLSLIHI